MAAHIDFTREFACIAEAVAYLFRLGFKTVDVGNDWRTMVNDNEHCCVFIERIAFLRVTLTNCSS